MTADMVSSAIGGLWKFDREFQPLVPFLLTEAISGHLALGGLDAQLGSFEAFYSNDAMLTELASYLDKDRRVQCREAMRRKAYGDYPPDAPYSSVHHDELLRCAADITRIIETKAGIDAPLREEQMQILVNFVRYIESDLMDETNRNRVRDYSMFLDFRWLANRLPPHSKIILWGATAHMAKDATAYPAFATMRNFGSYLHQTYGDRAFSLGFSAGSGSYRYSKKKNPELPPAPPGSLEKIAGAKNGLDTAYLGPSRLKGLGTIPGAAFSHEYRLVDWSRSLDGIVVFQEEHPPHSTRPGYD